jgi:hypothetical protein
MLSLYIIIRPATRAANPWKPRDAALAAFDSDAEALDEDVELGESLLAVLVPDGSSVSASMTASRLFTLGYTQKKGWPEGTHMCRRPLFVKTLGSMILALLK